jgi:hypothetical protein
MEIRPGLLLPSGRRVVGDAVDQPMHLCDMVVIASWAVGATFTAASAEKGSRLLAHFWPGDFMANDSKDDSVLGHIDGLVKDEERLSGTGSPLVHVQCPLDGLSRRRSNLRPDALI